MRTRDNVTEAAPAGVGRKSSRSFGLVGLTLVCSHVAAAKVLLVQARHTTLVSRQQMSLPIPGSASRSVLPNGPTRSGG